MAANRSTWKACANMFKSPKPENQLRVRLSGLLAGVVFLACGQPSPAQETNPGPSPASPMIVAQSLLNQDPKPQPVMRRHQEPVAATAPTRASGAANRPANANKSTPAGQVKKKKKKAPAPPAAPAASAKAKTKAKAETPIKVKTPAKPSTKAKRKAKQGD